MFKVADIRAGNLDAAGVRIDTVYTWVANTYAVYRTDERVIVQFADNEDLGRQQRLALAPLNPIKGEINGLIDGWRVSKNHDSNAKAKLFDRRVADALTVALQGDQAHALEILIAIKSDIVEERTSTARSEYLLVALGTMVVVVAIFAAITSDWFARSVYDFSNLTDSLWHGGAIGAAGALFSIALAIRTRSVLTDLQSRDNAIDAALRILIGTASAIILICLLRSGIVTINVFANKNPGEGGEEVAIIIAFIGGFSERLVGDFLSQALITGSASGNPLAGNAPSRTPPPGLTTPGPASERNPLGSTGPVIAGGGAPPPTFAAEQQPAAEDDELDGCISEGGALAEEQTQDVELPETTGGVEHA